MGQSCTETVSILYAVFFGAGDACVMIGLWSILSAFAVFIGVVVVLQVLARKFWARLTTQPKAFSDVHSSQVDRPIKDDPNYQNSAIRSAKR